MQQKVNSLSFQGQIPVEAHAPAPGGGPERSRPTPGVQPSQGGTANEPILGGPLPGGQSGTAGNIILSELFFKKFCCIYCEL